jgi:hypothetical protein
MRCALVLLALLALCSRPTCLQADDATHFCNIERRAAASLSASEFKEQFESKQRPVVIERAAQAAGWPAIGRWSLEHMVQTYGHLLVHVGEAVAVPDTSGFGNRSVVLRDFAEACALPSDVAVKETVFDRQEFVRQAGIELQAETSPALTYFEHWPQAGKGSTPYFSFGPKAIGLSFHAHSAAFNVVLFGAKQWFLYPPLSQPERVEPWTTSAAANSGDGGTASPASWSSEELFNMTFVELLPPTVWAATVKRRLLAQFRPLECVTRPGDVMYVPAGWAHAVANLEASAALAWQLPPQRSHHALDELAFRVAALGEHGRATEAPSLIKEQLVWLKQSSGKEHESTMLSQLDGLEPEDMLERMTAYVRVGEVRSDSVKGACNAALGTAKELLLRPPNSEIGPAKVHGWATAFEPVARCFLNAGEPAAAANAALEGIDATPPKSAVSRELYLLTAEAFRQQGFTKKAAKMEKRARRADSSRQAHIAPSSL